MGKMMTYVFLVAGIILLLNMAGFETMTGSVIETLGGNPDDVGNIQSKGLYIAVIAGIAALGLGAGVAVLMGTFGASSSNLLIVTTALMATPLIALVGDLISIANYAGSGWEANFVRLLIIPIALIYCLALYEWVGGRD